ncbi:MAG: Fic family protein [Faecalibacterium prausnitzii]
MFSKYDVYTTVQSMYCYPDTDVLINKLNIHDKAELKQAEEEFTAVKQVGHGRFTKTHLFRIHRFLFEDVYPFAGHIRKEQISKGDTMFYPPDLIDRELEAGVQNHSLQEAACRTG